MPRGSKRRRRSLLLLASKTRNPGAPPEVYRPSHSIPFMIVIPLLCLEFAWLERGARRYRYPLFLFMIYFGRFGQARITYLLTDTAAGGYTRGPLLGWCVFRWIDGSPHMFEPGQFGSVTAHQPTNTKSCPLCSVCV